MRRATAVFFPLLLIASVANAEPNLDPVLQLVEVTDTHLHKYLDLSVEIAGLGDQPITEELSAERDQLFAKTLELVGSYELVIGQADQEFEGWLKLCQTQEECLSASGVLDPYIEMRTKARMAQGLLEGLVIRERFMMHAEAAPN